MEAVPHLSLTDLTADLRRVYGVKRQHHYVAYFGTGEECEVSLDQGTVRVVPVRSELELRKLLPPLDDDDQQPIAFLVPWKSDIPVDLVGRFALHGRVRPIGKDSRLRHLFGVVEVDDAVRTCPLADYLLRPGTERSYRIGDSVLTLDAMWNVWLRQEWHLDMGAAPALDVLLGWAAVDRRGPGFVDAMSAASADGVREALLAWLHQRLGPTGPIAWRAWEQGRGRTVLELALLLESLVKAPLGEVRMWVKSQLRDQLGVDDDVAQQVTVTLARQAQSAMRYLGPRATPQELRAVARDADARVVDAEVRAALIDSTRLPSAWEQRLSALGEALRDAAISPTEKSFEEALRALRNLEGHVFFKDTDQEQRLQRADMAVKLLGWLVARPDAKLEPSNTPYGEAEALGRWYAEEGGFVDRARRTARGTAEDELGRGVQAIVELADAARSELDRRFAKGLTAWVEAGQPANQVIPLWDAFRRIGARFLEGNGLEGNDERRLLVLLLDGMAWSQATDLLASMGERAAPWGPLAWHTTKEGRVGEGRVPVVFASLPTVTDVSRSSFFAGKPFGPGAKVDTANDPAHWEANAAARKLVDGNDKPRLLTRSDGLTSAGAASPAALSQIADESRRVVALILNAIDDSLKASHAVRHDWPVERIVSLPDLLDAARRHGRAILLVSDHGHVPADRIQRVPAPTSGGGARWRPWPKPDAPLADNEIGVSSSQVYAKKGDHGVALLIDDASAYQGGTHGGEHGGATLAEVVAPCLLIGCNDVYEQMVEKDAALEPKGAVVPAWWHFDVATPGSVDHEPVVTRPSRRPKDDERQLGFAQIVPPASTEPAKAASEKAAPTSVFASSDVLKAHVASAKDREHVAKAVEVLLERQGATSAQAFAAAMQELPFRVSGLVSKLQEVLNLDGYEVLRFDPVNRQVFLDREKLAQLFEVKL